MKSKENKELHKGKQLGKGGKEIEIGKKRTIQDSARKTLQDTPQNWPYVNHLYSSEKVNRIVYLANQRRQGSRTKTYISLLQTPSWPEVPTFGFCSER